MHVWQDIDTAAPMAGAEGGPDSWRTYAAATPAGMTDGAQAGAVWVHCIDERVPHLCGYGTHCIAAPQVDTLAGAADIAAAAEYAAECADMAHAADVAWYARHGIDG